MSVTQLLNQKPVLTHAEVVADLLGKDARRSPRTVDSLLAYHVQSGRLLRVRRGLYVAVPPGNAPETYPVDPFLVAAKAADDAVLAYHTALEFFGRAYSTFERLYYLTATTPRPFRFRSYEFRGVPIPKSLVARHKQGFGVKQVPKGNLTIRVTSLERTLVDVLDRPELAGGWEELWRSLDLVEYFDLDAVVDYVLLLSNATTVAKVGYYLERHQTRLMVEQKHLGRLEKKRPQKPHYMQPGSRGGTLAARWNLIIPPAVATQGWEES